MRAARYEVEIIGMDDEYKNIGLFESESWPQMGHHIDIEVEDSRFQEYVVAGGWGSAERSVIYVVHPTREQPLKVFKAVPR